MRRSALFVVMVGLLAPALVACSSSTGGAGTAESIAGRWSVTYGAPTVVTISATGHSTYVMTGAQPVAVVGDHCKLRAGTVLARFAGSGSTYSGRHGLWDQTTCAFTRWTTLELTLTGNIASARLGNGEVRNYTRQRAGAGTASHTWWWLVIAAVLVLVAATVWALARRRRQGRRPEAR